ncbi:MAG: Crp/Fnr family transcriptional regulator [Lamprobacter sp.]|uniref:Crp/Fnr family transcriptional regulator n=1 Tax=Lamprobacter sp. TaxID=3100796 RepID=UPI002B25A959|nr:Crp/Fnr family transcriptional regulator [Lamprobacter sp.]MEA3642235.1 Crp/Fnr family transcriptional regulator [Lamprobacter sp.]
MIANSGQTDRLSALQQCLLPYGVEHEVNTGEQLDARLAQNCIGIVLRGQLRVIWEQDAGASDLALLRTGDWVNEQGFLLGEAPAHTLYRAAAFTRLLLIDIAQLNARLADGALADVQTRLHPALAEYLARRMTTLSDRLHQVRFADTESLILQVLQEARTWPSAMSHPEGTLVMAPCKLIAERIGCARATVSRLLGDLMRAGRLRREGRRLLLLDEPLVADAR